MLLCGALAKGTMPKRSQRDLDHETMDGGNEYYDAEYSYYSFYNDQDGSYYNTYGPAENTYYDYYYGEEWYDNSYYSYYITCDGMYSSWGDYNGEDYSYEGYDEWSDCTSDMAAMGEYYGMADCNDCAGASGDWLDMDYDEDWDWYYEDEDMSEDSWSLGPVTVSFDSSATKIAVTTVTAAMTVALAW